MAHILTEFSTEICYVRFSYLKMVHNRVPFLMFIPCSPYLGTISIESGSPHVEVSPKELPLPIKASVSFVYSCLGRKLVRDCALLLNHCNMIFNTSDRITCALKKTAQMTPSVTSLNLALFAVYLRRELWGIR